MQFEELSTSLPFTSLFATKDAKQLFCSISGSADGITYTTQGQFEHLIIHAKEDSNSSITIIANGVNELSIEAHIGRAAACEITVLLPKEAKGITVHQQAIVAEGASLKWNNLTLATEVEQDLVSHIDGAHGSCNVDWVFYAKENEQQKLLAENVFGALNGSGEITMKGVAEDSAHIVCNGMINIGLRGGGTDAYLTEDVLMLDSSAKVDAIPGLEIKTNEVKASHSATVSRVTEEDLFYFASRGIPKELARTMYVQGFLGNLLSTIPESSTKELALRYLEDKYVS